jgi:hypothetical protein
MKSIALPKTTGNGNVPPEILLLGEVIRENGTILNTYFADKSGNIWKVHGSFGVKPYLIGGGELVSDLSSLDNVKIASIFIAMESFVRTHANTPAYNLERSWSSQKEHNQPDTPTSKDKIIASLVAQVNGLATNLSNLQGEMQAHKETCTTMRDEWADHHADIHVSNAGRLNVPKLWSNLYQKVDDHIELDGKYDESNQLRLEGIDGRIDDLDSRINGHIKLENAGLGSIVDRLNEIEVELHNNPGKVLDWAHVNELFAKLDSKIDVRCDAILKELRQEMGNVRPRIAGIEHASIPKLKIDIDAVFSGLIALAKIVDDRSKIR